MGTVYIFVSDISVEYGFGFSSYVDNSVARLITGAPDPATTSSIRFSRELCPINNEGEIIIERYRAVGSNRKVSSQLKADSVSIASTRTLEVDHSVVCNTAAGCELLPAYSRDDGEFVFVFGVVVFGGYGYSSLRHYERIVFICV